MDRPFVLVAVVAITLVVLARLSTPALRRTAAHAYARKVNLQLDAALEDAVASRLARRQAAGVVTGAVLALVLAPVLRPGEEPAGAPWVSPLVVFLAFFLGTALGSAGVAWYESSRPLPPGPRLARATVPGHGDYVPRIERWGAWVMAAVSPAVAGGLMALDGAGLVELGDLPVPLVVAAVVAPALAVLADELSARWLLARRQVAGSTLELAWDDALRAKTLRDTVTVAVVTGAWAPLALVGSIAEELEGGWPANPAVGVVNGVGLVLMAALLVAGVASLVLRPEGHFRRTLWPLDAAVAGGAR